MKIVNIVRKELREINLLYTIIGGIIGIIISIACTISSANGRNSYGYYLITRPRGAPPMFILVLSFTIIIGLICAAYASAISVRYKSCRPHFFHATMFFLALIALLIIYIPMLLYGHSYFLALLVLMAAIVVCFMAIRELYSTLISASIALLICEIWLLYILWLNFCIMILN